MDGSASRPRHCLYLEQAREVVRGNERTYRQAERLADGVLHTLHSVQDRRGVILTSRRRSGKLRCGTTSPIEWIMRHGKRRRSSRRRTCNSMMDRREALLLVDRLKHRTRDPDVLTLCEYVHGTDVHGTMAGCPVDTAGCDAICLMPGVRGTSGGRDGEGKKDGAMGAETDADVRVAWSAARQPCPGVAPGRYCVRAGRGTGHGRPILWQSAQQRGYPRFPCASRRCPSTQASWSGMQSSPRSR